MFIFIEGKEMLYSKLYITSCKSEAIYDCEVWQPSGANKLRGFLLIDNRAHFKDTTPSFQQNIRQGIYFVQKLKPRSGTQQCVLSSMYSFTWDCNTALHKLATLPH